MKVGDIVICINANSLTGNRNPSPPLQLNREYIVNAIMECSCGSISLDVGISAVKTACNKCNFITEDVIWWCSSKRFIKKQTLEEKVPEALQEENYELLHQLKTEKLI